MNHEDKYYVRKCLSAGIIKSPCLELGGNYETCAQFLEPARIEHMTSEIEPGPNVDFVADFTSDVSVKSTFNGQTFGSVLAINVLEHTFEPIRVLDNIFSLLQPSGSCVLTSPAVWPLHDFPQDFYRLNPHFYEEYCKRRGYKLRADLFEYLCDKPIESFARDGQYYLPPLSENHFKRLRSRAINKIFNTDLRGVEFHNYICIGCVIEKH